jgi:hypothetical protein
MGATLPSGAVESTREALRNRHIRANGKTPSGARLRRVASLRGPPGGTEELGSRTLPRRDILPTAMPRRPGTTAAPPTEAIASPVCDFVVPLIAAAVRAPVVIAVTALGAGAVAGRGLLRLASRLFASCAAPAPRHHAGRVRERARAAEQAARASGLLSRRDR